MKPLMTIMLCMILTLITNCSNSPYTSEQLQQLKNSGLRADFHMQQEDVYSRKIPRWTKKPSRVTGDKFTIVGQATTNVSVNTDRLCEVASLDARGKALQAIQENLHVTETKANDLVDLDYSKSVISDSKGLIKHASEVKRFAVKRKRFTEDGFIVEKVCYVQIGIPVAVYQESMKKRQPASSKKMKY